MTNTKLAEAARQLDDAIKDLPDGCEGWLEPLDERIAELRAALAAQDAAQAQQAAGQELPPLPATDYSLCFYNEGGIQEAYGEGYDADQMHAYARAAVSAANPLAQRREPLTDDDVYRIVCEFFSQPWHRLVATEVVRATEKAHGIGATTGEQR